MNHEILYDQSFALAVVTLEQGERIMAESGAMVSMSPTIQLDSKMAGGGMMGAVKSAMGGESLYRDLNTKARSLLDRGPNRAWSGSIHVDAQ